MFWLVRARVAGRALWWALAAGLSLLALLFGFLLMSASVSGATTAYGCTIGAERQVSATTADAAALDQWMARSAPESPMIGTGQAMVESGLRHGVDPRAIAAIARLENQLGTAPRLSAQKHNSWGLGGPIESGMSFGTWEEGIEFTARLLAEDYIGEGLTTLDAIGGKWAPVGASNDPRGLNHGWGDKVGAYYAELGGDPEGPIQIGGSAAVALVQSPTSAQPPPDAGAGATPAPASAQITVKGVAADQEQLQNIQVILATGQEMGASPKVLVAAVATITVESTARNLDHGDRDSVGLFQQRPSQGWPASLDPATDARAFYERAMALDAENPSMSVNDIAQGVQRSGTPTAYARWEEEATRTVQVWAGGSLDTLTGGDTAGCEQEADDAAQVPIADGGVSGALTPVPATGKKQALPIAALQGGEAEHVDSAVYGSALMVLSRFPDAQISDGWRYPSDGEYKPGSMHSCGRAADYVGSRETILAIERWAQGMGFPQALGPVSDPAGHNDHAHIGFGDCSGDVVYVIAGASTIDVGTSASSSGGGWAGGGWGRWGSRWGWGSEGTGAAGATLNVPTRGAGQWVFPVIGKASFSDDFSAPRPAGTHCGGVHCAIDILAPSGKPIVAPFDGVLDRVGSTGLGGNRLWVQGASDQAYMAHFTSFASGVRSGLRVRAGQILGTVGNTGAPTAPPHLHIAWQHRGGAGWTWGNPYQLLLAAVRAG